MAATLVGFTGYALPAEMPELLSLLPQWDASFALRGGGGYKDNVFLSHFNRQGSAFVEAEGEFLALRVAATGPDVEFFATADAQRFLGEDTAHTEYSALARAKIEQDVKNWGNASLAVQYFGQDQILDVSEDETNRQALAVTGHNFTGRPGLRARLSSQCWVAFEPTVSRQFLAPPLDDYWQGGPSVTCGGSFGRSSEVSVSYEPSWRFYDTDPALTAEGDVIPGTHRHRFQQEARLKWRQAWDEGNHWRTTATFGGRLNKENGGGFSDHVRWLASARAEYRARPWLASAEGRVAQYFYQNRTTWSASSASPLRRTEFVLSARVERDLSAKLSLAAGYEYEQVLSNEPLETYTVSTVSGSLQWEF